MTGYLFDPVRCKCASNDPAQTAKLGNDLFAADRDIDRNDMTFAQIGQDVATSQRVLKQGAIIGGVYNIIKLIGQGGMGEVYLAEHQSLHRRFALKLIPPDQVTNNSWQRFQQEAKSIGALEHKNIVKVMDLGIHKGYLPFYAMEFVEGQTLAEILERSGPMPIAVILDIFIQVAAGVDFAHRAGIVHRDLKPANIMVVQTASADGKQNYTVKILDFGLAKLVNQDRNEQSLTSVGDIFGSPYYMSPEQCRGDKIDNRSDLYSIGCTLFECLTGRPPFAGNISSSVLLSQQEVEPPTLAAATRARAIF